MASQAYIHDRALKELSGKKESAFKNDNAELRELRLLVDAEKAAILKAQAPKKAAPAPKKATIRTRKAASAVTTRKASKAELRANLVKALDAFLNA